MRQKYEISRSGAGNTLNIREYAIIDKHLKNVPSTLLQSSDYAFLCEASYEGDKIASSISRGVAALTVALRTRNIFPIAPFAEKIAEAVILLYSENEDAAVSLFFNDADLVAAWS